MIAWKVATSGGQITSWTQIVDTDTNGSGQDWWVDGYYTITGSGSAVTFDAENHLYLELWNVKTAKGDNTVDVSALKITGGELCEAGNDTMVVTPTVTVPELALIFIPLVLVIPFMMRKFKFNYANNHSIQDRT